MIRYTFLADTDCAYSSPAKGNIICVGSAIFKTHHYQNDLNVLSRPARAKLMESEGHRHPKVYSDILALLFARHEDLLFSFNIRPLFLASFQRVATWKPFMFWHL